MRERIEKIRNDIKTNLFSKSDELVIVGLRIIELLEEINEGMKGEEKDAGRDEPEPERRHRARPKPKPVRRVGVGSRGGIGRGERQRLARIASQGIASGENI